MLKMGIVGFVGVVFPYVALAGGWLEGPSHACWVNTEGTNSFYYCGAQDSGCAGKNERSGHSKSTYYHGDKETINGVVYYCCGGASSTKMGVWQKGSLKADAETLEIKFENGKCVYQESKNDCGELVSTKEKECQYGPKECDDRYELVLVDGVNKCQLCDGEEKFWDETNNECVFCSKEHSLIVMGSDGKKTCKLRTELTQVTNANMKICWQCSNTEAFKKCALAQANGKSLSANIKKQCRLE